MSLSGTMKASLSASWVVTSIDLPACSKASITGCSITTSALVSVALADTIVMMYITEQIRMRKDDVAKGTNDAKGIKGLYTKLEAAKASLHAFRSKGKSI